MDSGNWLPVQHGLLRNFTGPKKLNAEILIRVKYNASHGRTKVFRFTPLSGRSSRVRQSLY
jgi:hypothetical protein